MRLGRLLGVVCWGPTLRHGWGTAIDFCNKCHLVKDRAFRHVGEALLQSQGGGMSQLLSVRREHFRRERMTRLACYLTPRRKTIYSPWYALLPWLRRHVARPLAPTPTLLFLPECCSTPLVPMATMGSSLGNHPRCSVRHID